MSCRLSGSALALIAAGLAAAQAEPVLVTPDLEPLVRELFREIASLSDHRSDAQVPPIFEMPQHEIEEAVCDAPCNVVAAYLPAKGIYLASSLDPRREPADRAALVHELVHYLQHRERRFSALPPCHRARAEEQEAFAIQNAYLLRMGSQLRVAFHDDFDCEAGGGTSRGAGLN